MHFSDYIIDQHNGDDSPQSGQRYPTCTK